MQTDYLRYLIKIVECGSMNKAANALYVTQVALTKAMQRLEAELGYELLIRNKNGITLTEKGKMVYEDAKKVLSLEQRWQSLSADDQGICGKVRLAFINSVCSSALDQVIFNCRKQYPGIELISKECRSCDFLHIFENRKANIGICNYFNWSRDKVYQLAERLDLVVEELFQDKCYLFMSANNALADKPYLESRDLKDLRFAMYSDENDVISVPVISDYFKPENVFPMSSMQSMVRAIIEEDVTIINTKVFAELNPYVAKGDVVYKEIVGLDYPTTYYMIRSKDGCITQAEEIVVGLLKETLPEIYPACC